MVEPHPYEIQYNFAGFQASNPSTPLPATALDNELENIELALGDTQTSLSEIRTSLLLPFPLPTQWAPHTAYIIGATVFHGAQLHLALVDHTSSTDFVADLVAGKWEEIADFTPPDIIDAASVTYNNSTSHLAANHVAPALDEVTSRIVTIETTPISRAKLAPDVLAALLPAGLVSPYAGTTAPAGWLFCDGSAVSRSTYTSLYLAIGVTHGAGDGSTTFNLPDLRGRAVAGKDDMGGTAASRLTGSTLGVDGLTLGAAGGRQSHTLVSGELAAHTHSASAAGVGAHGHQLRSSATNSSDPPDGVGGVLLDGTAVSNPPVYTGTTPDNAFGHQLAAGGAHTHTITVASAGADGAHNNVQPTLVLNYIVFTGVVF